MQYRTMLAREVARLEALTGRRFGDPSAPLLLSVRSGSSISQPGMLSTYLNVGINESVVEGMAAGDHGSRAWFAWDCHRRFLQNYGMSAGMERDGFRRHHDRPQGAAGQAVQAGISPAGRCGPWPCPTRDALLDRGLTIEERPFEQLLLARAGRAGQLGFAPGPDVPQDHGHQRRLGHGRDHHVHGLRQPVPAGRVGRVFHPQPPLVRGPDHALGGLCPGQPGRGRGFRPGEDHAGERGAGGDRRAHGRGHPGNPFSGDLRPAQGDGPAVHPGMGVRPPGSGVHL